MRNKTILSLFLVSTQVFVLTAVNAQPENREQRMQEKTLIKEEKTAQKDAKLLDKQEKTEAKAQRVTASCDKVSAIISKRLINLQNSLNKSSQTISNIESSIQTKIDALKTAGKDTSLIESNFAKFKSDSSQILAEKQALINQLSDLAGSDCKADKKTFASSLKIFNSSLRTHILNYGNLKSFLRTTVIIEINKLNESEIK
jgi:hypothetical protein